jgi:flagellar biogenesis protein FliO
VDNVPALFLRMVISMAVVISLMMLAARLTTKRRGPMLRRPNPSAGIEILDRQGLGRNASVVVVRVAGKSRLLGVTDASISNLGEIDETEAVDVSDVIASSEATWTGLSGNLDEVDLVDSSQARKGMLEQLREMTVRRS